MYITSSSYCYGSAERLDRHLQPHFLDSCFLCRKPLGSNSDIFMYRGNTPFCSKECRQEQIEIDESSEMMTMTAPWKKRLPSSSSSSSATRSVVRKSQPKDSSSSPSTANKAAVRTGTVAVA